MTLCGSGPSRFSVGVWFSLPPRCDIGVWPRCRGSGSRLFSSASSPPTSVISGWTWSGSSLTLCQGPRRSWHHGHGEAGRCLTPGLSATRGSTSPSARDCRARSVCRGLSSWTTGWPPWARLAPAAHTTRCCWPSLPWTPPTPCATCTWTKATSCGRAGPHGSTWVTVDPGRPPSCSSIGPPPPAPSPHSRLCCSASRCTAGRRSGVQGAVRAPRSRF